MRSLTAALAAGGLLLALIASTAVAGRASDVLLDTFVGNQAYLCGARYPGRHDRWVPKDGGIVTVTQPAKVTSVVFPLMVEVGPARIQVRIVAAKAWDGIDPGTGSGDRSSGTTSPTSPRSSVRRAHPLVSVIYHAGALPSPVRPARARS